MSDNNKPAGKVNLAGRKISAQELLAEAGEIGFSVSAPIDVEKLCEILGLTLSTSDSDRPLATIGSITATEKGAEIWVNPQENKYQPRKRFTIAHEIGHYCLHIAPGLEKMFSDTAKTMSRTQSYWDENEYEANNFAAELLMPKELILDEGKKLISSYKEAFGVEKMPKSEFVSQLASKLNVSATAMEYRLKNLKVIPS